MANLKYLLVLLLVFGFVYAVAISVSDVQYPRNLNLGETARVNITTNHGIDDSAGVRVSLFVEGDYRAIASKDDVFYSSGQKTWRFPLSGLEKGETKFSYRVEYFTADTGGYIVCSTSNKCTGEFTINVVDPTTPPANNTPPVNNNPPVNNSNNNANNNANTQNNTANLNNTTNNPDNSSGSTSGSGNNAPLTADEIKALLNTSRSTTTAPPADNTTPDSSSQPLLENKLFLGVVGACCCITLVIILLVSGVLGHKHLNRQKVKKRIISQSSDDEE